VHHQPDQGNQRRVVVNGIFVGVIGPHIVHITQWTATLWGNPGLCQFIGAAYEMSLSSRYM